MDGVTLYVDKNEILGLAGHNGAGKSTLTRIIAGAEKPDAGEMRLNGQSVRFRSPDDATSHGIAQVPQAPDDYPEFDRPREPCAWDAPSIVSARRPRSWHVVGGSKTRSSRDGAIVQTLLGHDVTDAKISHATVEGRLEMSNA